MPNQHKTPLLGWNPTSAEDAARVRAEAERRGVRLKVVLDEMLRIYVERLDCPSSPVAATREQPKPVPQNRTGHAPTCKCLRCRPK